MGCCVRSLGGGVCNCGAGPGLAGSGRVFGWAGFVAAGGGAGWLLGLFAAGVSAGLPGLPAFGEFPGWLPGRSMFGVAGFPGGASLTIGCAAGVFAGRKVCTSFRSRGCPGCAAKASCCLAKGTGGGGGSALAITCRLATAGGGAATCSALLALDPNTLSRKGATVALELTGAEVISSAFTATAALATGCAVTKARCGTAVIAPATFLFR